MKEEDMQCKAVKNNGQQCNRETKEGQEYCWQHKDQADQGGRPKKYTSVKQMEKDIEKYFQSCIKQIKDPEAGEITYKQIRPFTITGLALALNMDRRTLLNYEKDDKFFPTIKKAKLKCENFAEEQLFKSGTVSGVIFNLKNNYGWKDKQEIDHKGDLEIDVTLEDE